MRHTLGRSAALAASVFACACGSSPNAFLPSEVPGVGATIRGTVVGNASTTSNAVRAMSGTSGIRVTVVGTGIATSTNGNGEFVLEGVPAGSVTLEFETDGGHARLEIRGLMPGQEIAITVTVAGSDASLVDVDGEEVEVEGRVESLEPFVVAGRSFDVTDDTRVLRHGDEIAFGDIRVGDVVEVKGVRLPDGSLLALRIRLEDTADDEDEDSDDDEDDEDDDEDDDDHDEGGEHDDDDDE